MFFEKLELIEKKYEDISAKIAETDISKDRDLYLGLMKELKACSAVVDEYRNYKSIDADIREHAALADGEDRELAELAASELPDLKKALAESEERLKVLLVPKDPNDDKNVIVEIRAGTGGEEAALFAYDLYRMYCMFSDRIGWKTELISCNETELGGFREVCFSVSGEAAYSKLKFESGVHRVQRVPKTESQGRIQTSTATVAVLPEADDIDVEISDNDVKVETIKSSGAGGQHINKTESAIRLIHKPTGIVIECQDERSQFKNKDRAFKILRAKLYDMKQQEQQSKLSDERKRQIGTGDRCERIRTYNFPQGRVTDHRINYTVYSLESFLNGNIDEMLNALIVADTAEKIKEVF